MFDKHETNQSVINHSAHNPRHLVKVTDRSGKVIVLQTERIHKISTFNGGAFVDFITGGFIELNLSVEELFDQIQSHLEKIPTLDN
ncbi:MULTISPECIES: hypothetical protein [unclassified Providencia]|uniref:hypothetical protein n=1 Tax=unclassified Providencia TaxID=2633465 RepID=UPI003C2D40DE